MNAASTSVPTVVIVDDEADHVLIVEYVFAETAPDLPVESIASPAEAAHRIVDAPRGALILVDRLFGGADSIPALGEMRALRPDLRLVLLSAALSDEDRDAALRNGAERAEEKPRSLRGWRDLVESLLYGDEHSNSRHPEIR